MGLDPRTKKLLIAAGGIAALNLFTYVRRRRKFGGDTYLLNEVIFKKPGWQKLLKRRIEAYDQVSDEGIFRYRLVKGKGDRPHRFYTRKGPKWGALRSTPGVRKLNLGNSGRWASAVLGIVGGIAIARWIVRR